MERIFIMDESSNINLLDEEFVKLMTELKEPDKTDEQKGKILDRLQTISKIRNERVKVNSEVVDFEEKRKEESRKTQQKAKDDEREFWSKIGLTAFEVLIPAGLYCIWAYIGFRFEEEGNIRSAILKQNNGRIKASR